MNVRSAYRLLAWLVIIFVPIEILMVAGPAHDQEFKGLWQVWHPYYVLILGAVTLPVWILYIVPLARRLGGWKTAFGRLTLWLTIAQSMFIIVGPLFTFAEITCPTWSDACTWPVGWVHTPGWGDVFYVLTFPLAALGIAQLLVILGTSVRTELRRHWYVPTIAALIFAALIAPFGADIAFAPQQSTGENAVEIGYVLGSFILLSVSVFGVLRLRALGSSPFTLPVRLLLFGTTMVVIGALINVHTATVGAPWDINDPSITPLTIGVITWMAAFLVLGGRIERMLADPAG